MTPERLDALFPGDVLFCSGGWNLGHFLVARVSRDGRKMAISLVRLDGFGRTVLPRTTILLTHVEALNEEWQPSSLRFNPVDRINVPRLEAFKFTDL